MNNGKSNIHQLRRQGATKIKHFDYSLLSDAELIELTRFAIGSWCLTDRQRMRLIFVCQFTAELKAGG